MYKKSNMTEMSFLMNQGI